MLTAFSLLFYYFYLTAFSMHVTFKLFFLINKSGLNSLGRGYLITQAGLRRGQIILRVVLELPGGTGLVGADRLAPQQTIKGRSVKCRSAGRETLRHSEVMMTQDTLRKTGLKGLRVCVSAHETCNECSSRTNSKGVAKCTRYLAAPAKHTDCS